MKNIAVFLFTVTLVIWGCRSGKLSSSAEHGKSGTVKEITAAPDNEKQQEKTDFSLPETWILGYFSPGKLNQQPHSKWFIPGYDNYRYNEDVVRKLLDLEMNDVSILVVMGTWCPDSRREVPRFMKILTAINFPLERVRFLGVDNTKFVPVDNYESLSIQRVPTFIFYVKNVEAGRIIENPVTSLEQDMLNILAVNK